MKARHLLSIFGPGLSAATALLLVCSPAFGSPPPPEAGDEFLPQLYEALGGDDWHENEGWMDPDVHWCEWYGVECQTVGEGTSVVYEEIRSLELPENNLTGELTEALAEQLLHSFAPRSELDLSGNAISGEMYFYPSFTPTVDLSGNRLSGTLPPLEDPSAIAHDQALFLDRNNFSGPIPESWSQAQLDRLDLSDNQLTSGHQAAIDAIKDSHGNGRVWLTGNPLEGELTDAVLPAPLSERDELGGSGGIDICFTNLTVEDSDVRDWLAEHHVASADFDQCLNRERTEVDATLSGSWYNPDRSGEGVSLMMLDNGLPLLYSFSFDLEGNQQWTLEVGTAGEKWAAWDELKETRGTFNEGLRREQGYDFIRPIADFRFDRVADDTVNLYRRYTDLRGCGPWGDFSESDGPIICPIDRVSDRMDYQRLSELAGTTCSNQNALQRYSGVWYNPERSGEGLVVEVLSDGRAVIYWFTYRPDGSNRQAWMIAEGRVQTGPDVIPVPPAREAWVQRAPTYRPIGGVYGPEFDPQDIEIDEWGTVTVTFYDTGSADFAWEGNDPAFGSGSYELERLAQPMLAECETENKR